jgi:hypothetical protein
MTTYIMSHDWDYDLISKEERIEMGEPSEPPTIEVALPIAQQIIAMVEDGSYRNWPKSHARPEATEDDFPDHQYYCNQWVIDGVPVAAYVGADKDGNAVGAEVHFRTDEHDMFHEADMSGWSHMDYFITHGGQVPWEELLELVEGDNLERQCVDCDRTFMEDPRNKEAGWYSSKCGLCTGNTGLCDVCGTEVIWEDLIIEDDDDDDDDDKYCADCHKSSSNAVD